MNCRKEDCKYYDIRATGYCSYHSIGSCKRYKSTNPATVHDKKRKSMNAYKNFMKLKNIVIDRSYVEENTLVFEYHSIEGGVIGRIKFKVLGV